MQNKRVVKMSRKSYNNRDKRRHSYVKWNLSENQKKNRIIRLWNCVRYFGFCRFSSNNNCVKMSWQTGRRKDNSQNYRWGI